MLVILPMTFRQRVRVRKFDSAKARSFRETRDALAGESPEGGRIFEFSRPPLLAVSDGAETAETAETRSNEEKNAARCPSCASVAAIARKSQRLQECIRVEREEGGGRRKESKKRGRGEEKERRDSGAVSRLLRNR